MDIKEFFAAVGGDYENTLMRIPSEKTLIKFLLKFAEEPSYTQLKTAFETGDVASAFRAAHTLKGTAATLGLGDLTAAASELTEKLRNATELPCVSEVEPLDIAYAQTVKAIGLLAE